MAARDNDSAKDTGETTFADRGADGAGVGGNTPVAAGDPAPAGDPLAYRGKGDNISKRVDHIERWIIEMGYGGDVRRFDAAAGLDFDAK